MQKIFTHWFWLLLIGCLPTVMQATTTSGTTMRNVNVADGIVTFGAAAGANGVDWEADEVFQGYQNQVNWYLTWDDNNLYLGRIGGNNAEGSILYIRADYPGATFVNRGFNYDQLEPDVTPMGGVNFAAYLKETADEYRTASNLTWSGADNSLTPAFSSQPNGDNMEVAIPWTAISGGNGRPTNFRFILYQVVIGGACGQEFVYGESPWGTGNVGDGPRVGVNDGTPISARQPGGCNVGDSVATRWWGCLPVIGNISGNAWNFSIEHLVRDTLVCTGTAIIPLVANAVGTGTWTQLLGPTVSPTNPTQASTTVSWLPSSGQYVFEFTQNTNGCYATHDTVKFEAVEPSQIYMPMDMVICEGTTICLTPWNAELISTILWSTGDTTDTICVPPGYYFFDAIDSNGCSTADTISIYGNALPEISNVVVNTSLCPVISFNVQTTGGPTRFDWDLGGGVHLTTATAQFDYTAWGNGTYAYTIRVEDTCGVDSSSGTVQINCIVGVNEEIRPMPQVYPNPNLGSFTISSGSPDIALEAVRLLDMMGRIVWDMPNQFQQGHSAYMEIPNLAAGQYLLEVQMQGEMFHRRIEVAR